MTTRRAFLASGATGMAAMLGPSVARAASGPTSSRASSYDADVLVIGAGLAGLHAARLLEAGGARVVVLEGENRVGGRLHTLDELPGAPDAGGIQVGAGYTRVKAVAAQLGVVLQTGDGAGAGRAQVPGNTYYINGVTVPSAGWSGSAANRLTGPARAIEPASLGRMFARGLPRFDAPDGWLDAPAALDIPLGSAFAAAGADGEALRLLQANLNGNSLAGMSQLHLARTLAVYADGTGPISTIAGGSQRLPEAMAATLGEPVRTGTLVTALREDAAGVTVQTPSGTVRAGHAICTIPFAALRHIGLESPLTSAVARMIAGLPYTRASFAYLSARTAFWREDGLPDTLWTDDPLIGRVFVLGDGAGSGGGNVPPMLKLWTTGVGADLLDRMAPDMARAEIVRRIEIMRPAAAGQLQVERLYSWQRSPFARGIYHHIGTGMAADLATATRHTGTRLHFAGEHLAQDASGMEGAMESGARAAATVAARL